MTTSRQQHDNASSSKATPLRFGSTVSCSSFEDEQVYQQHEAVQHFQAYPGPPLRSIVKTPKQAYDALVTKGIKTAEASAIKIFHQSFYAGIYIGFGGMLSMVIAGGLANAAEENPAIQTFVFAALFPVNLLIILLTGGCLFTGTSGVVPAALYEGKVHWMQIPRTFAISWAGNMLGALVFAYLIDFCEMNEGDTAALAIKVAEKKVAKSFLITFIKGIGCNWLVCMAVFLSSQAQDMAGKMVGIWFPISCFVAIGFEHIPANMFMIPMGMLAGADVSVTDLIVKNFIPVTLGNAFAGAICVGAGYSFAFGALGEYEWFCSKPKSSSKEEKDASETEEKDIESPTKPTTTAPTSSSQTTKVHPHNNNNNNKNTAPPEVAPAGAFQRAWGSLTDESLGVQVTEMRTSRRDNHQGDFSYSDSLHV